jgi:hypothetical protein
VHIPKSAGSSITKALIPYLGKAYQGLPTEGHGWQTKYHSLRGMHSKLAVANFKGMEREFDGYTIFGVARNPWDRATSHFRCGWMGSGQEFAEVCLAGPKGWHKFTAPQTTWLYGGKMSANFIIRFESLEADWKRLCKQVGIPYSPLPKMLVNEHSTRGESWRQYYEGHEDAAEAIGKIYKADVERFGYTFDG